MDNKPKGWRATPKRLAEGAGYKVVKVCGLYVVLGYRTRWGQWRSAITYKPGIYAPTGMDWSKTNNCSAGLHFYKNEESIYLKSWRLYTGCFLKDTVFSEAHLTTFPNGFYAKKARANLLFVGNSHEEVTKLIEAYLTPTEVTVV
jgi:hypothetical protein